MPPDDAATIAAGAPVLFPQNGPTAGGVVRLNLGEFVLPRAGTYSVDFSVSVTEPGQLAIALDSGDGMVELSYAVYGRATGTSQIAGDALITTTAASSKVELRNPAGNTPALTITPLGWRRASCGCFHGDPAAGLTRVIAAIGNGGILLRCEFPASRTAGIRSCTRGQN
jgi:hypothetical protein